jgi:Cu/Ag efflux protein CusF
MDAKRTKKRSDLNKRIVAIQAAIARLRHERASVQRDEFLEMTKALRQVELNAAALAIQFTRIAHIQAEVDAIKRALVKAKLLDPPP